MAAGIKDKVAILGMGCSKFGERWDASPEDLMVEAYNEAMADAGIAPEQLDEAALARFMTMSYAPDPDLFIRTGGEMRISNFLLWQAAYAELFFTDCLWPDFGASDIDAALAAFRQRDRRFGGVKHESREPTPQLVGAG
jgi:undecaprenyl diphosphate synthase